MNIDLETLLCFLDHKNQSVNFPIVAYTFISEADIFFRFQ